MKKHALVTAFIFLVFLSNISIMFPSDFSFTTKCMTILEALLTTEMLGIRNCFICSDSQSTIVPHDFKLFSFWICYFQSHIPNLFNIPLCNLDDIKHLLWVLIYSDLWLRNRGLSCRDMCSFYSSSY